MGLVGFEASVRVPFLWDFMYRIMDTVIDNDYVLQIIDYVHLVNFIESKIWFIMSLYALGDNISSVSLNEIIEGIYWEYHPSFEPYLFSLYNQSSG